MITLLSGQKFVVAQQVIMRQGIVAGAEITPEKKECFSFWF
jgi:hypothetical protein